MELRNLDDYEFLTGQTYQEAPVKEPLAVEYKEVRPLKADLQKRWDEITFFANIAVFSLLLALLTYLSTVFLIPVLAVPLAFLLSLSIFLVCKKGIRRVILNFTK